MVCVLSRGGKEHFHILNTNEDLPLCEFVVNYRSRIGVYVTGTFSDGREFSLSRVKNKKWYQTRIVEIHFENEHVGDIIPKGNFFTKQHISVSGLPELPCLNDKTPFLHRMEFSDSLVIESKLSSGKLFSLSNSVSLIVSEPLWESRPWLVPTVAIKFYDSAMLG